MAVQTDNTNNKRNVSLPIIIVAVVLLVAFIGWLSYKNFVPQKAPPTAASQAYDAWFDKVAKDSGGDFSKVSPDDQAKLQSHTYGHGQQALMGYAKEHGYAH